MSRAQTRQAVPPKTFTLLVHVVARHDLAGEAQRMVSPHHSLLLSY